MTRIALLDDYQNIALKSADWDSLPAECSVDAFQDHLTDLAALTDRLQPYDVLVIMRERTPFPRALIKTLPNLKLLITTSGRNKSIDLEACADHDVLVCHTELGHTPTAELTWGLILSLAKRIPAEDRGTREGHWGVEVADGLAGKVLGVIGLGKLGTKVAQIGKMFDMEIIAWSPNLTDERAQEIGAQRVEKDELFARSDYVSVHVVLSDRSRGLVGEEDLARMKRRVRHRATAAGRSASDAAEQRHHPAYRRVRPRELRSLVWRRAGRHHGLARRQADPDTDAGPKLGLTGSSRRSRPPMPRRRPDAMTTPRVPSTRRRRPRHSDHDISAHTADPHRHS